jgi:hypothetical protein
VAALTINTIALTGLDDPTPEAAAEAGDTFVNDGKTVLRIDEDGTESTTITINSLVNCDQGHDHDITLTVNNETKWIGPFPPNRFNNSSGATSITYSAHEGITVTAFKL